MCGSCAGRNKGVPGYGDMGVGRYSGHWGMGAVGFAPLLRPPGFKGLSQSLPVVPLDQFPPPQKKKKLLRLSNP